MCHRLEYTMLQRARDDERVRRPEQQAATEPTREPNAKPAEPGPRPAPEVELEVD